MPLWGTAHASEDNKPKYLPEKDWSMIKYKINTGAANNLRKVRKFGI